MGLHEAFVQRHLNGAQHALVLALGVDDALGARPRLRRNTGRMNMPVW